MNDNFFVFSDIHGRYDLWEQVKEYLHDQPAIFLGDAADRGPDGYQIMTALSKTRPKNLIWIGDFVRLYAFVNQDLSQRQ